ncbi:HU domain-containing protein [Arundinibacter roseus]|uniref:SPOR domain-containing protein n=1 Tax=Arundinibacter roseus TaxID=2070510 RepID=A0A4R4KJZ2_9BACT|nr:SPOR domain-containing protein [Arundinibacter roseus]TDB66959.1 SPOR domain-containing protein [Arundinibacter roseus]
MIKVDKYIRKLLFEHDCVIIPEFGGLLTHHVSAHYDEVNATYHPSRKRLAFNEVLKIDDGLLAYYVSVNEKVAREEAAQYIRQYVDGLWQALKGGQSVQIERIGVFQTNNEGKLVFEPDYSQNYNAEWYGLQPIQVKEVIGTVVEAELSATVSEETVFELDTTKQANISGKVSWFKWASAAVLAGTIISVSILYKPMDSDSLLSTLNPFTMVKDLYISTISKPRVAEPTEVVVFVDEPIVTAPTEPIVALDLEPTEAANVVSTGIEDSKVSTEIREFEKAESATAEKYFLIAGSFEKERNAVKLKKKLLRNGFEEAMILENEAGKLIKVSAGSYKNMKLAMADKSKLDALTNAEAWVFRKR